MKCPTLGDAGKLCKLSKDALPFLLRFRLLDSQPHRDMTPSRQPPHHRHCCTGFFIRDQEELPPGSTDLSIATCPEDLFTIDASLFHHFFQDAIDGGLPTPTLITLVTFAQNCLDKFAATENPFIGQFPLLGIS